MPITNGLKPLDYRAAIHGRQLRTQGVGKEEEKQLIPKSAMICPDRATIQYDETDPNPETGSREGNFSPVA